MLVLCFLPLIVGFAFLAMGVFGYLPPWDIAMSEDASYGSYYIAVDVYHKLFISFGIPSFILAVIYIALSADRIMNKQQIREKPWLYLLLLLLCWSTLSTFLSDDPIKALTGSSYLNDGLFSYYIYAAVFVIASSIREEKSRRKILISYGTMVCILSVVLVLQSLGMRQLVYYFHSQRAVVFNQFNHFGYVLCMGIMAFVGLYLYDEYSRSLNRYFYLFGVGFLTFSLLLNDTFGCWLASVVALLVAYLFYFVSGRKLSLRALLPLLAFAVVSAICYFFPAEGINGLAQNIAQLIHDNASIIKNSSDAGSAGSGRFTLWKDTIERIIQRPIIGFGPEGFRGDNAITNGDSPHNEYLQIAGFLGIPALVFYLGALISLAVHHWKHIKKLDPLVLAVSGVTVVYLVSACFGNPIFNTAPYLWMFLGLTTATSEKDEPLIWIDDSKVVSQLNAKSNGKRIAGIVAIGTLLVAILLYTSHSISVSTENSNEKADLECMSIAYSVAQIKLQNKSDKALGEYWFDSATFKLIKSDRKKPKPYGMGSEMNGNALTEFHKDTGVETNYDTEKDYTDKVILVSISKDANNKYVVNTEWVD